jgi:hypothetical protein
LRAKLVQEQLIKEADQPYTIVCSCNGIIEIAARPP